jgi:hypothetical protein
MLYLLLQLLLFTGIVGALFACFLAAPAALADDLLPPTSGAYHAAQHHWRELDQARDWEGLKAQVRHWQEMSSPGWTEADIEDVARHLNQAVFRFAEPSMALPQ